MDTQGAIEVTERYAVAWLGPFGRPDSNRARAEFAAGLRQALLDYGVEDVEIQNVRFEWGDDGKGIMRVDVSLRVG